MLRCASKSYGPKLGPTKLDAVYLDLMKVEQKMVQIWALYVADLKGIASILVSDCKLNLRISSYPLKAEHCDIAPKYYWTQRWL